MTNGAARNDPSYGLTPLRSPLLAELGQSCPNCWAAPGPDCRPGPGPRPKRAKNRQNFPVDGPARRCQHRAMLGETQNQFPLTRAAPSTWGHAKEANSKIMKPICNQLTVRAGHCTARLHHKRSRRPMPGFPVAALLLAPFLLATVPAPGQQGNAKTKQPPVTDPAMVRLKADYDKKIDEYNTLASHREQTPSVILRFSEETQPTRAEVL
jgi:hypothetical protein